MVAKLFFMQQRSLTGASLLLRMPLSGISHVKTHKTKEGCSIQAGMGSDGTGGKSSSEGKFGFVGICVLFHGNLAEHLPIVCFVVH